MKRREFIQAGMALSSIAAMPSWARAQAVAKDMGGEFFLQFYMDGGWDTTLATEAWDFTQPVDEKKIFIEYAQHETLAFQNSFLPPSIKPMAKYFDRLTVFNGVIMSPQEVGHNSPKIFALSGAADGSEANYACQFVQNFYDPQIASVLSNTSIETAGKNLKTASMQSLQSILDYLSDGTDADTGNVISKAYGDLDLIAAQFKKIQKEYQSTLGQIADPDVRQICTGFLSGYFPAAAFSTPSFLDSHNDHLNVHKAGLIANFEFVTKFLDGLALVPWQNSGQSLLDVTTVVITSEFTRTPALNVSKGKDHNPFSNAMIVLSPKFKPGLVGRSRILDAQLSPIGVPTLVAMPLHVDTLQPLLQDQDTFMMTPSNIYASLMDASGKLSQTSPEQFRKATLLKSIYR